MRPSHVGTDKHQGFSAFLANLAEEPQSYLDLTMSPFHNQRPHLRSNNPTFHFFKHSSSMPKYSFW